MNVLIGCEESGVVREAFRALGHDAWSNDIDPAGDGSPHHFEGDVMLAIEWAVWDLIILHPPCDYLAVCGNRWYAKNTPGYQQRLDSIEWTKKLWTRACEVCPKVVLENPASVIFPRLDSPKPDMTQYIQPHQFGHKEFKKTGLALHNVPPLEYTDELEAPLPGTPEHLEWQKVWRMTPSPERKRLRSRTYQGIADAMASQWGEGRGDE
jgi:hypothetical protein